MFPTAESRQAVKTVLVTKTVTDSDLEQCSLDVSFTGLPLTHTVVKTP